MNPGEYEVNGIRYGWAHDLDEYEHRERIDGVWFRCGCFPDIEKAEKARHELAEAESEGWVYLMARETQTRYRIHPDGSQPQWYDDEQWTEDIDDADWAEHYRKGREVAEAEAADMRSLAADTRDKYLDFRDAAMELVDNVRDLLIVIRGPWPPSARALECVEAAAKKVGAKL